VIILEPKDTVMPPSTPQRVVPGQMWSWEFIVSDGTYMFQVVGGMAYMPALMIVKRGDVLMVVKEDDIGPPEIGAFQSYPQTQKKQWVIAMLHNRLVYIDKDCFNTDGSIMKLIQDA
jgi:hypothetical protein